MRQVEKRSESRQFLQIPLSFHLLQSDSLPKEYFSETSNISRAGILMKSPVPLQVGSPIALHLRVPTHISGSPRSVLRYYGHVVHEVRMAGGILAYGIQIVRPLRETLGFSPQGRHATATYRSNLEVPNTIGT